jgi:hypothetical protein
MEAGEEKVHHEHQGDEIHEGMDVPFIIHHGLLTCQAKFSFSIAF